MDLNDENHDESQTAITSTSQCNERICTLLEKELPLRSPEQQWHGELQIRGTEQGNDLGLETDIFEYGEVVKELSYARDELAKLELEWSSALKAKIKAAGELKASERRARIFSNFMEGLKKEIQEANEEQFLAELARVEADRETSEIETKRKSEAAEYVKKMGEVGGRIRQLRSENDRSKELEKMLAVTNSDVNVLQNEMELIRAMDINFNRASEIELEAAKKELASLNELEFQLMASMDLVRGEIAQIVDESKKLNKLEKDTDCAVQYLKTKLLKTKSKLKSSMAANGRSTTVISNLSMALQELQKDIKEVTGETELLCKETKAKKLEADESNLCIDLTHARLESAMKELQAAKSSEAIALSKLKAVCERQMSARSLLSQPNTTIITISKFEYQYLRQRAEAALEVADMKVLAAQAWTEAIEAGEKEMSLKADIALSDIMEHRAMEEKDLDNKKYSVKENAFVFQIAVPKRRSFRGENVPGESKRVKIRRSSVSSARRRSITQSPTSFSVKKKRKVMTNLVRFLKERTIKKSS